MTSQVHSSTYCTGVCSNGLWCDKATLHNINIKNNDFQCRTDVNRLPEEKRGSDRVHLGIYAAQDLFNWFKESPGIQWSTSIGKLQTVRIYYLIVIYFLLFL